MVNLIQKHDFFGGTWNMKILKFISFNIRAKSILIQLSIRLCWNLSWAHVNIPHAVLLRILHFNCSFISLPCWNLLWNVSGFSIMGNLFLVIKHLPTNPRISSKSANDSSYHRIPIVPSFGELPQCGEWFIRISMESSLLEQFSLSKRHASIARTLVQVPLRWPLSLRIFSTPHRWVRQVSHETYRNNIDL